LLFLILAAANPQPGTSLPISPDSATGRHRIFVVDVSYSMDSDLGGISPLERARHLLKDIVESGRPEDTYSVVTMSGRPRAVVPEPTRNQDIVLQVVDDLQTMGSPVNVPATCNVVADLLRSSDRGVVSSTIHEVVFVTDLRHVGWSVDSSSQEQSFPGGDSASISTEVGDGSGQGGPTVSALTQLSRRASVTILDVGFPRSVDESYDLDSVGESSLSANASNGPGSTTTTNIADGSMGSGFSSLSRNIGIKSMIAKNAPITVGQTIRIDLSLINWSRDSIANLPVELYVNGRQVARTTTSMSGKASSPVVLRHRFERPGRYLLEARIPKDSIGKDNVRRLVVEVRDSLHVQIVEESGSVCGSYIGAALAPFSGKPIALGERPAIDVSRARISQWTSHDSTNIDCLILCDPVQLSNSEIQLIRTHLKGGKGVVLFLGPHVDLANLNGKLYDIPTDQVEPPLLPGRLTGPRSNSTFRIDPLNYEHPIAHAFEGNRQCGLLTTPIENYQHIELGDSPEIRIALNMGNGDPFVVSKEFSPGRLVYVTTVPSPDWASLPYWPSFLPLTHELVRYAVLGNRSHREYVAGEIMEIAIPDSYTRPLHVRLPNGDVFPVLQDSETLPDAESLRWNDTDQVGVYMVEPLDAGEVEAETTAPLSTLLSNASELGMVAVNPDSVEGDLTRVPEESLIFPSESRIRIVKALNASDLERLAVLAPVSNFRFVRLLLFLALFFSFIELYWSRRLAQN
jgi:hypothetical protein